MTRDERRAAMPIVTEFIDDFRKVFGELNAIHAKENGHQVNWIRSDVYQSGRAQKTGAGEA